jgi:hypothetical protein
MSKRLQVLLDEEELRDLRAAAQHEGLSISDWVRRALRDARRRVPERDLGAKLSAIRAAARHEFPTADIDQMLAEIERGYGAPPPE